MASVVLGKGGWGGSGVDGAAAVQETNLPGTDYGHYGSHRAQSTEHIAPKHLSQSTCHRAPAIMFFLQTLHVTLHYMVSLIALALKLSALFC